MKYKNLLVIFIFIFFVLFFDMTDQSGKDHYTSNTMIVRKNGWRGGGRDECGQGWEADMYPIDT